jgi:hypothetical protein
MWTPAAASQACEVQYAALAMHASTGTIQSNEDHSVPAYCAQSILNTNHSMCDSHASQPYMQVWFTGAPRHIHLLLISGLLLLLLFAALQGYYRRGDAYFMLGKFKDAIKDLKTVSVLQAAGLGMVQQQWGCLTAAGAGMAQQQWGFLAAAGAGMTRSTGVVQQGQQGQAWCSSSEWIPTCSCRHSTDQRQEQVCKASRAWLQNGENGEA